MAFLPVGLAMISATLGTAAAAATPVALGIAAGAATYGAAGYGITSAIGSGDKKPTTPSSIPSVAAPASTPQTALPDVPTSAQEIAELKEEEKKKLTQGRTKRGTLLTGPQGILTPANVSLKSLLGQ